MVSVIYLVSTAIDHKFDPFPFNLSRLKVDRSLTRDYNIDLL